MNKLSSHGSYVLVIPIEVNDGLCKGRIYSETSRHQLNMDQIVYYLEKDMTNILFKGIDLHVILHYHIFFKEVKIKEEKVNLDGMNFEFKGITI